MHVAADLNWFLQFVVFAFAGAFALLYLVRNTASRYFLVDSNFDSSAADFSSLDRRETENMSGPAGGADVLDSCAVCGLLTKKQCARCKMVKYCSAACQKSHWHSDHKTKCKDLQSLYKANNAKSSAMRGRKASVVPCGGSSRILKPSNKILFPYEDFVELFKWNTPGYPPCGLLNCGNSCFANVVLQCLAFTRPLVAYLLKKGHRLECQRDDWCFLCEFQTHVERASRSVHPFSPMNILSRLPNIGGNLGYGKQEDAHEFMRFAIDTMQSVCLDEFGGEKAVHPSYQLTTLIQHIFGGRLRSQVICVGCHNVSNQFENMMDLTVEIHGDAGSLEECLDQFTAKESLHGDNMYKCDSCNDYVMAWKRLTIQQAPNILTIALKRFQSGRFGKLNKRVTFPETLDLSPYMSESEDGNNVYKLYAVIVHVDMLNASFFGHYICYVKDFNGKWYRTDDCKIASVDLDEVLSQGAYMLMYNRICTRLSCLLPTELLRNEEKENMTTNEVQPAVCLSNVVHMDGLVDSAQSTSSSAELKDICGKELSVPTEAEDARSDDADMLSSDQSLLTVKDVEFVDNDRLPIAPNEVMSQPNPTNNSSIDRTSIQVDAHNSNVEGGVNSSLIRKLEDDSAAVENSCSSEESDASVDALTTTELRDEAESSNSPSPPGKIGYGNGFTSSSAVQSIDGEDPTTIFKPLFAPGFLAKKPKKKCMNVEENGEHHMEMAA